MHDRIGTIKRSKASWRIEFQGSDGADGNVNLGCYVEHDQRTRSSLELAYRLYQQLQSSHNNDLKTLHDWHTNFCELPESRGVVLHVIFLQTPRYYCCTPRAFDET